MRHILISGMFPVLRLVQTCGQRLGLFRSDSLRVLICHETPEEYHDHFRCYLEDIQKSHCFVNVDQFVAMLSGEKAIVGHNILLTFDDANQSNRMMAEKVLAPMDIKAVFFIPTGFVRCETEQSIAKYVRERLKLPLFVGEPSPLDWNDLQWLIDQGHEIGAHTVSHARLSLLAEDEALQREIIGSGDELERKLGVHVRLFAYPFGDIDSINSVALAMIRERYQICFSGVRGDNGHGVDCMAVRREAIHVQDGLYYNNFFTIGGGSFFYSDARKRLDEMVAVL